MASVNYVRKALRGQGFFYLVDSNLPGGRLKVADFIGAELGPLNDNREEIDVQDSEEPDVYSHRATADLTLKIRSASSYLPKLLWNATRTTGGKMAIRNEQQTVPGTPFAVTLDNEDSAAGDAVVVCVRSLNSDGSEKYLYTEVDAASETAGESYSVSGNALSFAASDEGELVSIDYMVTNTNYIKNVVDLTNITYPEFEVWVTFKELQTNGGGSLGNVAIKCPKVRWKSGFFPGMDVKAMMDKSITLEVLESIEIHQPPDNPTAT